MPLVSVVIPCFNAAGLLERAAQSALDQEVPTEVILVDDGSTDDSVLCAQKVMRAHPDRVRVILQPNQGPAAARNAGMRIANGQYLCFLDADDEIGGGFLAPALKLFDQGDSIVAVQGRALLVDLHRKVEKWQQDVMESTMPGNLLIRAETVRQIGGFPVDARFRGQVAGEDGTFRTELGRFGQILRLDLPFIKHRLRPGGHADLFLDRAILQNGRVAFKYLLPEEQDGTLNAAASQYRRQVADRMIARLLENLKAQVSGVEQFQQPAQMLRSPTADLHPAEGFALYELAKGWPARGGAVSLGTNGASAVAWLAAGCRDSNHGGVTWLVGTPAAADQGLLRDSGLASFVQIDSLREQPRREPIRLLLIASDALGELTPMSLDPWLASLSRDGLLAVLAPPAESAAFLKTTISDVNHWREALSFRRLSVYRKLPGG